MSTDEHGSAKKAGKKGGGSMAMDLPTLGEQQQLLNVESVLQHSYLNLQVKEVLGEVSSSVSDSKSVTSFVDSLTSFCTQEARLFEGVTMTKEWLAENEVKNVTLSAPSNNPTVIFSAPQSLEVVGSFSTKTITAPFVNIDLAFTIPNDCFAERDILNYAYFDKKMIYVAAMAMILRKFCNVNNGSTESGSNDDKAKPKSKKSKSSDNEQVQVSYSKTDLADSGEVFLSYFKADFRKPFIILRPVLQGNKKLKSLEFRLFPVVTSSLFRPVQLNFNKNNVRPKQWIQQLQDRKNDTSMITGDQRAGSGDSDGLDMSLLTPTAHYNLTITEDMAQSIQRRILQGICQSGSVAIELIRIFKVWLTQRSLRFGLETFDSHSASLLVCYLVQTKRVMTTSPVADAFQVLLKFISDFNNKVTTLNFSKFEIVSTNIEESQSSLSRSVVSLLHPIGTRDKFIEFDVFWRVSDSCMTTLVLEASKSLKMLEQCDSNTRDSNFRRLLLTPSSIAEREDLIFHVAFSSDNLGLHTPIQSSSSRNKHSGRSSSNSNSSSGGGSSSVESSNALADVAPIDALPWMYMSQQSFRLLCKGLTDRVSSISTVAKAKSQYVMSSSDSDKEISKISTGMSEMYSHPLSLSSVPSKCDIVYTIGVTLNADNARRKVDKCPMSPSNETGSKSSSNMVTSVDSSIKDDFISFWMGKCELRRFNDGTIVESVVWEGDKLDHQTTVSSTNAYNRGTLIVGEIVRFLLSQHFPAIAGAHGRAVTSPSLALEWGRESRQISDGSSSSSSSSSSDIDSRISKGSDIMTQCRKAIESLDKLQIMLVKRLNGVPLALEEILAVDPELRYTCLQAPLPNPTIFHAGNQNSKELMKEIQGKKVSLVAKPFLILGRLESSGKWPLNLSAIKNFKRVILIALMENLKKDHEIVSIMGDITLDIFIDGYIFRLLLLNDKDVTASRTFPVDIDTFITDPYHNSRLLRLSTHHQVVRSLVSLHSCFPDTVRIATRWFNSHYLTDLLSSEVVELIVASVFLDFYPKSSPPSTAFNAFLQVLRRLHTVNWDSEPLIVDFDSSITAVERSRISVQFEETKRNRQAHPIMYIVTSFDRERAFAPVLWDYSLSRTELSVLVSCSKSSFDVLKDIIVNKFETNDITSNYQASCFHVDEFPSVQSVVQRSNMCLYFLKEVSQLLQTQSGPAPAFGVVQSFKNAPSSKIDYKDVTSFHSFTNSNFIIQESVMRLLRTRFEKYALIFWNGNVGDKVLLMWKPAMFLPRNFAIGDTSLRIAVVASSSDTAANGKGKSNSKSNSNSNSNSSKAGGGGRGAESVITVPNIGEIVALVLSTCDGYVDKFDVL